MNELTTQSWYQSLLADLKKLEFTGIVLTKWNIGKRILEDIDTIRSCFKRIRVFKTSNKSREMLENIKIDL